jgi:phosphoesterase RecJ-like protein
MRNCDIEETLALLRAVRGTVVISTHVTPDGDAIGSELALHRLLAKLGVTARIINTDAAPEVLRFMDEDGVLECYEADTHDAVLETAGLIVCLDFNAPSRLRRMERAVSASPVPRLVIDHHLDAQPFADHACIDTEACSTAQIVYRLVAASGVPLDSALAVPLYVGLVTDSGSFRFERTTPEVHRTAAALLEAGVDPMRVHRQVYDEYPFGRSTLLGRMLAGMRSECDGRVTILTVTRAMFEETGSTVEDVENMVNYGLGIKGVEVTALLTELPDAVKISFRSRGLHDVNDVAARFGGGGHRLAAGARVEGAVLADITTRVSEALCRKVRGEAGEADRVC